MSPPGTRLVLVRHGQSRAMVEGFAGGERGCLGLTDRGRLQARALADRWAAADELGPVARLLSSKLPRAVETAEILAPALGGLAVVEDAALNEMDPGEGDGLAWDEWERRYGHFDLAAEPFRPLSPGGESWAAFGRRATTALAGLGRADEGSTVVVCHGGIIEQSFVLGFGLAAQTAPGSRLVTPPPASVTEWSVEVPEGGALSWRLVRYADAAHLETLDATGRPPPADR
jgi:probable phosphoglycerate mutase